MFRCPKDYTLRKMWIEKCGINEDAPEIEISAIRVCSTHFELDCFTNTALKNRLKPGSVPLLFLDSGKKIIDFLLFYFVLFFLSELFEDELLFELSAGS